MKPIHMYLDECIERGICKNDSEIGLRLAVTRSAISHWRSGTSAPSDEQAIKLARLISKPEIELMAEAAAARAKSPEARSYWERIAKYSATAASVVAMTAVVSSLGVTLFLTTASEAVAKTTGYDAVTAANKHYRHYRGKIRTAIAALRRLATWLLRGDNLAY